MGILTRSYIVSILLLLGCNANLSVIPRENTLKSIQTQQPISSTDVINSITENNNATVSPTISQKIVSDLPPPTVEAANDELVDIESQITSKDELSVHPITAELFPQINSDLMFITEGRLVRWDHFTANLEELLAPLNPGDIGITGSNNLTLPESVVEYSVDKRGSNIIVLRTKGIAANGIVLFDVSSMKFDDRSVITLLDDIPRIYDLSLSPKGDWIVYRDQELGGDIYLIQNQLNATPILIASCTHTTKYRCQSFLWNPNGDHLMWSDSEGIWAYQLDTDSLALVRANSYQVIDQTGDIADIKVQFIPLEWSPIGRYVIVGTHALNSDIQWTSLLDNKTGRLAEIPNTYGVNPSSTNTTWTEDGRLISVHSSEDRSSLAMTLWNVVPTRDDLLMIDTHFKIPFDVSGEKIYVDHGDTLFVSRLHRINHRFFLFTLEVANRDTETKLLLLDSRYGELEFISNIPADTERFDCSQDGKSILIHGSHGAISIVPADRHAVYSLYPLTGEQADQISWFQSSLDPGS